MAENEHGANSKKTQVMWRVAATSVSQNRLCRLRCDAIRKASSHKKSYELCIFVWLAHRLARSDVLRTDQLLFWVEVLIRPSQNRRRLYSSLGKLPVDSTHAPTGSDLGTNEGVRVAGIAHQATLRATLYRGICEPVLEPCLAQLLQALIF